MSSVLPPKQLKLAATLIAAQVKGDLEELQADYLGEEQMAELEPIIRDGIYTGLYTILHAVQENWCEAHVQWLKMNIPTEGDEPRLTREVRALRDDVRSGRVKAGGGAAALSGSDGSDEPGEDGASTPPSLE